MTALSPLQAIHRHCAECCNGQAAQIRYCPVHECPLFPFRFGTNPFTRADVERLEPLRTKEPAHANE